MEIGLDDVRNLTFELYLAQRTNALLQAENEELKHIIEQLRTGTEATDNATADTLGLYRAPTD